MDSKLYEEMQNLSEQIENLSNQIEKSLKLCEDMLTNIVSFSDYDFEVLKKVEFFRKMIFLSWLYLDRGKKANFCKDPHIQLSASNYYVMASNLTIEIQDGIETLSKSILSK